MVIAFGADAIVEPDDMIEFVREVPAPRELQFLSAFPRIDSEDNTVDFGEIVRQNRTAKYRSFDGRIHVSERDGFSHSRVPLIPLSTSLAMGELERLQLEFARTGGTNMGRLATAAYDDATQLTREVQNRLELAWGDVLTDGKLTVSEGGYAGEADFGVPANQKVAIATSNLKWTAANAATMKPLTDLQAWADVYRANNGVSPARIRTSLVRRRAVLQAKEVIDAVHGSTAGRTRVTLTELDELLRGEGLPIFDEPYDTSLMVDGTETRVLPDDKVTLLPEDLSELGGTAWGVTATALELMNSDYSDLTFEEAAGIVGVVVKEGPPFRSFTYVDAVAMPVLTNARRLFIADVE